MVKLALNYLFHDKKRLLISILGTSLVVILIIVCQSILNGTLTEAENYSNKVGSDIFVTQDGVSKMLASISFFPETKIDEIENIEGVDTCSPIISNKYCLSKDGKVIAAYLIGYDLESGIGGPWLITKGRNVDSDDEIVIDENIAKANNYKLNDKIEINNKKLKIVGFSGETNAMANQYMFVSLDAARNIFLTDTMVSYALIRVDKSVKVNDIVKKINNQISGVDAVDREQFALNNRQVQSDMLSGPMTIMVFINFLIGCLVVAFSMYTISRSRLKDYAMLKAVGMINRKCFFVVIIQAFITVVIGLCVGLMLSVFISMFINSIGEGITSTIDYSLCALTCVLCLIMSLFASIIPMYHLLKIDLASVFQS